MKNNQNQTRNSNPNPNQNYSLPAFVLTKAKGAIAHTKQEIVQAKERIPAEYHDFLVLLPQNVKINDNKYTVSRDAQEIGIFSHDKGTYVSIEKPYMTVDGRLRMARDEHAKDNKKLDILSPVFVPFNERIIVSVTVESEIHGTTTGTIEVGQGGGVDYSNPFANAQTSAIGRALGFMGYGLLGTGIIESDEEYNSSQERPPANTTNANTTTTPPASTGNPPIEHTVMIVGDVVFNRDRSSTVPVMLRTKEKETVDLVIPTQHEQFAQSIMTNDVIHVLGWLNMPSKRLRASDHAPRIETKQAV